MYGHGSSSGLPSDGPVLFTGSRGSMQTCADPEDPTASGSQGRPLPVDHLVEAPDPSSIQMPSFKSERTSLRTISERHACLRVNTSRQSSSSDPKLWTEPGYTSRTGLLSTKVHNEDQQPNIYVEAGSRQKLPQEFSYFSSFGSGDELWAGKAHQQRCSPSALPAPVLRDVAPLQQAMPIPAGESTHLQLPGLMQPGAAVCDVALLQQPSPVLATLHSPSAVLGGDGVISPKHQFSSSWNDNSPLLSSTLPTSPKRKTSMSDVSDITTPSTMSELASPTGSRRPSGVSFTTGSRRPSGAGSRRPSGTSGRPSSEQLWPSLSGPAIEALSAALEKGPVQSSTFRELLKDHQTEQQPALAGISSHAARSSSPASPAIHEQAIYYSPAAAEAAPSEVREDAREASTSLCEEDESQFTTTMLHSLPSDYSRDRLAKQLDESGFSKKYDFLYLPVDFRKKRCFGYAFINFVTHEDALAFTETYTGFHDWDTPSDKGPAHVTWSSAHQGLEGHVNRYRNSPVMHETVLDEFKPILLKDGVRIPFPPPLTTIRKPRIRELRHGSQPALN